MDTKTWAITTALQSTTVLTISSTDCGRGRSGSGGYFGKPTSPRPPPPFAPLRWIEKHTTQMRLRHAHPTAPVLTTPSTDCGRGSTAYHRFTAWFIVHCRCCRIPGIRLGSVGFRGAISYCTWLPSLSCVKEAGIKATLGTHLRLCIEVKDLTHPGLRPRPKGLRVFTRVRPTGSLQITAILRIKIIVDYDK